MSNRQNSVEIAIRLKDEVSGGLKDIKNNVKGVQEAVTALDGGLSGVGAKLGKTQGDSRGTSGSGAESWTGKVRTSLDGLAKNALSDLDQAFASRTPSEGSPEEVAVQDRLGGGEDSVQARFAQELEALREKNRTELEELTQHGESRADLLQTQSNEEVRIRAEQNSTEERLNQERLQMTQGFAGSLSGVMDQLYKSGVAQGQDVFRVYQALAVAEATISTYKSAQAAYAQGVAFGGLGGAVLGSVMAAAAVAAGMARVAMIKNAQPKGYAFGGLIGGPDRGERADNVTIRATPGEYMLDRSSVRHYGVPVLEALRRRRIPRSVLESFGTPSLPTSSTRTAYAFGGEVGTGSFSGVAGGSGLGVQSTATGQQDALTIINVMDFQREFDRALASSRGRRVLVNVLGEEGIG